MLKKAEASLGSVLELTEVALDKGARKAALRLCCGIVLVRSKLTYLVTR